MAVAHDATSELTAFTASNSWTHTPAGTPRGVCVAIIQDLAVSDVISGVTYGGAAMTKVGVAIQTAGAEDGAVYLFHLGTGLGTGAKTIAVTVSSGTTAKCGYAWSVTAASDTEAVSYQEMEDSAPASGTFAVSHTGSFTNYGIFAACFSGVANVATIVIPSAPAAFTLVGTAKDFGTTCGKAARLVRATTDANPAPSWASTSGQPACLGSMIVREPVVATLEAYRTQARYAW